MHKFLRAIGFSEVKTREQLQKLIQRVIEDASESRFTVNKDEILYGDFYLECGPGFGMTVCGEYDAYDNFHPEYSFPCLIPSNISCIERSSIDRHIATNSYAGVCEDDKIGISIIYYLINRIDFMKHSFKDGDYMNGVAVSLSGLSTGGMIMMPLAKNENDRKKEFRLGQKRDKLIKAAREGSEEAIESLTLGDIDVYSSISRKLKETDVYTIVDTYFMPYGIECDQYSILGEITALKEETNSFTGEELFLMTLSCNGVSIDLCINKKDLFGEPAVGRRFKGNLWLQGELAL